MSRDRDRDIAFGHGTVILIRTAASTLEILGDTNLRDISRKSRLHIAAAVRQLLEDAHTHVELAIKELAEPTTMDKLVDMRDREVQERQRANRLHDEVEKITAIAAEASQRADLLQENLVQMQNQSAEHHGEANRLRRELDVAHHHEGVMRGDLERKTQALEVQTKIATDMSGKVTALEGHIKGLKHGMPVMPVALAPHPAAEGEIKATVVLTPHEE